jgi:hypothetical protein
MICQSMQALRRDVVSMVELTQWYCVIWARDNAASSSFSKLPHMTLFSWPCRWYCSCKEATEAKRVRTWDSRQLKDKLARDGTADEVICLGDLPMVFGV